MTFLDSTDIPGYIWRKRDKNRTWGVWARDDRHLSEAEKERQWEAARAATAKRERATVERIGAEMPVPERDKHYRRLMRRLGLHSADRADLERRGMTADQIERSLFLSVERDQRLLLPAQGNLPGISRDGWSLQTYNGYSTPCITVEGHIAAHQIVGRRGGKFWLSSYSETDRPDGPGPQVGGELPLTVRRPQQVTRKAIALVEGIGSKPFLTAERLGAVTVGAAGGAFASSPKLLKHTVDTLSAELGTKRIEFQPDAGMMDASRRSVRERYRATWALLESWGYEVAIGWWDQWDKADGDIDEIDHPEQVKFITVGKFNQLSGDVIQSDPSPRGDGFEPKSREEWLAQKDAQARSNWKKTYAFTPTSTVKQRYVDTGSDVTDMALWLHALKSDMGTGKTYELIRILGELEGLGAIAVGSRNSLLIQSCLRWSGGDNAKFYHLHGNDAFPLIGKKDSRLALCFDSLHYFKPEDFDGKILILDEALSVIKHGLLSNTLRDRRGECLDIFKEAVKRAAIVIAWDGNNCDLTVNYLAALRGENANVLKQVNRFRGDRLNVEIVQAVSDEGKPLLRDRSPVERKLREALQAAQHLPEGEAQAFAAITDSQTQAEALDDKFTAEGYRVFRLDSKTVKTEAGKAFLKAPDKFLGENQRYNLIILSPTAESGIDISITNYFAHGFAFFHGVIDTPTQLQFLRRFRKVLNWTAFCQAYTTLENWEGNRSPFAKRIQSQVVEYLQMDAIAALDGDGRRLALEGLINELSDQLDDAHSQTALKLLAARNFERSHTRECFVHMLTEAGHTVTTVEAGNDRELAKELAEVKDTIQDADASAVFHSPTISVSKAISIMSSFKASLEDHYAAQKALLLARIPGMEQTAEWTPELVKRLLFTHRGELAQLERYWMLNHMDAAKECSRQQWARRMDEGMGRALDIRTDYIKLKALDHLGVLKMATSSEAYTEDSPEVQHIYKQCKQSKRLQTALGRSPGKTTPMDFVGRLMADVGIKSSSRVLPRAGKRDREREYQYLTPELSDTGRAMLICIGKRLEKYLSSKSAETSQGKAADVDHLGPSSSINIGRGDPRQTKPSTEFEGDPENTYQFPIGTLVWWGTSMSQWEVIGYENGAARLQIYGIPGWLTERVVDVGELRVS